jgi:hypothetical protein
MLPQSKLSENSINDILKGIYLGDFKNTTEIISKFEITLSNLFFILRGETWKTVSDKFCTQFNCRLSDLRSKITAIEHHSTSTLTNLKVIKIRVRLKLGESITLLAKEFNVKYPTIHNIKTRKSWKYIPNETILTEQYMFEINSLPLKPINSCV